MFVSNRKYVLGFCFCLLLNNLHGQLSLESIFLTDNYATESAKSIQFLHTITKFVKLTNGKTNSTISFYDKTNKLSEEWSIAKNKNGNWNAVIFSNNDEYFLVNNNCNQLYRYSYYCDYYVGNKNGMLNPLSDMKQIYPEFSPDDKFIAFIKDNNLFIKLTQQTTEIQITSDGAWNKIINGKSDWVYEEELKLTKAFEWNPESNKIAYLKFDESQVKEYSIPLYYDMQYPNLFSYKYPKTGEENAKVSLWYYDLKTKKNKAIHLPYAYEYLPRIYWTKNGNEIISMLLNRQQDTLLLIGYNIKTGKSRLIYRETDEKFINVPSYVKFLTDDSFIITSEKNGYNHLYHYDKNGELIRQISSGNFELAEIYGIDEKNNLIYFQSNEGNELEKSIFQLNYITLEKQILSKERGTNTAKFSNDFSYFICTFSASNTPPKLSLVHTDDLSSATIETNNKVFDSIIILPQKEFIKIPFKDSYLNAWIIKPTNVDTTIKHPLLFIVYGGPGSQEVLNEWHSKNDLFHYFLAEQGFAVACVDNRGTGGRGSEFKKSTYLNLGKNETEDIVYAANYLSKMDYIDKNRIGIFGSSYGGFLAANCLLEGNDIFKAAVVSRPVCDWNLYDNIFTERYMRTPKENPAGFSNFNPIALAKKLKGNLLLIHGTGDDNVHFQHTLHLINALNDANKTYQLYIYPDAMHGNTGKKMSYDYYLKIYNFLKNKL